MARGKRIIRRTGRPATRLREAEALELAHKAPHHDMPLLITDVKFGPDSAEWVISTATVGSGHVVRIDDATGAVLEVAPWGVR